MPRRRPTHDTRILLMTLAAGLPGTLMTLLIFWLGDYTPKVQWTITVLVLGVYLGFAFAARQRVIMPLQTLSNLLAALREGDSSIRARITRPDDPLGEVLLEANILAETLRQQRLGEVEATALLSKVMEEIDVAVFAFDDHRRLALVNRAGERLLDRPVERLRGATADDLGLSDALAADTPRVLDVGFPGGVGKWEARRTSFRLGGLPHQLLVLSDVSRPLRDEERLAWQRLMRVLGHEINNSLTPIKSIAGSLDALLSRGPLPPDWQEDMRRGLGIITARSEALGRFTAAYSRLARLPKPTFEPVDIHTLLTRVVALETRLAVQIRPGPTTVVDADRDQLEQLLINLVRNAVDAALETGGGVAVSWTKRAGFLDLYVDDEGPGLANPANLFVPFFTTKPGGSGIGLVLSRQIAEAHGGNVTLEDLPPEGGSHESRGGNHEDRGGSREDRRGTREGAKGCRAWLRLPIRHAHRQHTPTVAGVLRRG
ncbi:MAG: PAS domain-containing sensor histidine kinase [Acidobacteria bacterium]|nr:PAS domain-containing sensor histidine kinase [Acidobacteriota bacterium]